MNSYKFFVLSSNSRQRLHRFRQMHDKRPVHQHHSPQNQSWYQHQQKHIPKTNIQALTSNSPAHLSRSLRNNSYTRSFDFVMTFLLATRKFDLNHWNFGYRRIIWCRKGGWGNWTFGFKFNDVFGWRRSCVCEVWNKVGNISFRS